jgi:CelD/BcsL family acetyltransferase involved in cellulose biosynthesis
VAATPGGRLTVELGRDLDLGPADGTALAALLESRPTVAVFLSKAWLSGFFADRPAGARPGLVLFREGGTLRGMAPIAVRQRRGHVRVALLGGGHGSDRTDLVAARGFESACADAFVAWLQEAFGRRFVLELRDVPAESPLWGGIFRANAERGSRLALQAREVHTLPFLDLAETSAAEAASKGRPWHPGSLEKHRRWLERRGPLAIERLEDPGEVLHAFDCLVRFLHVRWSGRAGGSVLDDARAFRFHRHVLPRLLAERRLRMLRLRSGPRTVAVFYGVASGGWWGYCLAGYDREWAGRIHLGRLALAAAIECAAREGATEFDFLKGAHATKYAWPVRERATVDADVYAPGPGAQLARVAWASREAAAALWKSARRALPSLRVWGQSREAAASPRCGGPKSARTA